MLSIFELKVLQKIVYFDKVKCLFCFKDEECSKSFILGQTFITIDDVASRNSISLSLSLSLALEWDLPSFQEERTAKTSHYVKNGRIFRVVGNASNSRRNRKTTINRKTFRHQIITVCRVGTHLHTLQKTKTLVFEIKKDTLIKRRICLQ